MINHPADTVLEEPLISEEEEVMLSQGEKEEEIVLREDQLLYIVPGKTQAKQRHVVFGKRVRPENMDDYFIRVYRGANHRGLVTEIILDTFSVGGVIVGSVKATTRNCCLVSRQERSYLAVVQINTSTIFYRTSTEHDKNILKCWQAKIREEIGHVKDWELKDWGNGGENARHRQRLCLTTSGLSICTVNPPRCIQHFQHDDCRLCQTRLQQEQLELQFWQKGSTHTYSFKTSRNEAIATDIRTHLHHLNPGDPSYMGEDIYQINKLATSQHLSSRQMCALITQETMPSPTEGSPPIDDTGDTNEETMAANRNSAKHICFTLHSVLKQEFPKPNTLGLSAEVREQLCLTLYIDEYPCVKGWKHLADAVGLVYESVQIIEAFLKNHLCQQSAAEIVLRYWQSTYNRNVHDCHPCTKDGLLNILENVLERHELVSLVQEENI